MDYKNSKIYRIVCNETGLCYVGSTTSTLTKRLSRHKSNYKLFLNGTYSNLASFPIIEKGNYDIVLIEEYPCENKQQLHARERYYIETMECINKRIPNRPKQEYMKEFYTNNRDKILEQQQNKREENREEYNRKKREEYKKRMLSKI